MPRRLLFGLLAVLAVFAANLGFRHYRQRYAVDTDEAGVAVARVVTERLSRAADLRVSTLSGIVQTTASDVRGPLDALQSSRVYKAPFAVDYFGDAGRIEPTRMRWDAKTRALLVDAPDVRIGTIAIDDARGSVVQERGMIITRGASEAMRHTGAVKAQRLVGERARDPANLAKARENARTAIASLLGAALQAAGVGRVTVTVRFPFEGRPEDRRWDMSRSLAEVLGKPR